MQHRSMATLTGVGLLLITAAPSRADESRQFDELRHKVDEQASVIQRQQTMIQQLIEKVGQLETRLPSQSSVATASLPARLDLGGQELAALPTEIVQQPAAKRTLEFNGYVDIGYVDARGGGQTTSSTAEQINARGDTLTSLGLDGDSSFLVNELDLDVKAHLTPSLDVVAGVDLLPRKLTYTVSGGTAPNDAFEMETAYVAYAPFSEPSRWADTLFGDLTLSAGKFDSPMGLEYRMNEAPARVNISRSLMSIYWTGYPVGVKARGKLLKTALDEFGHSVLTYNLALTNAEPWLDAFVDGDRATNQRRVFNGRLSYGFDLLKGFFESGFSWAYGPRINQGDNKTITGSVILDSRFERGPWTVRAEYDYSNLDRPRTGGTAATFSHLYLETYYALMRPRWLPAGIPMVSLTPYYRYDTRDLNSTTAAGSATTLIEMNRHTFALRYTARPGSMWKWEYQLNGEAEGASVNDNVWLASYVQQF